MLEKYLPKRQVILDELYPYYCFDEWLPMLAEYYKNGEFDSNEKRFSLFRRLTVLGYGIEEFLGITGDNHRFKFCTPYDEPKPDKLSSEQILLADELLKKIVNEFSE